MKKYFIIVAILLIVFFVGFGDMGKKELGQQQEVVDRFNEDDAHFAILEVQGQYGSSMAQTIEKMMRLETAHFTSKQYRVTGSAGMEVGKWQNLPADSVDGFVIMNDADLSDGADKFIVWKSVKDFCFYLAEYIIRHEGNFARWYSTNIQAQQEYEAKLDGINTHFV